MYNIDFRPLIVVIAIVSAFVGWALIESILWVFSHISVDWNSK